MHSVTPIYTCTAKERLRSDKGRLEPKNEQNHYDQPLQKQWSNAKAKVEELLQSARKHNFMSASCSIFVIWKLKLISKSIIFHSLKFKWEQCKIGILS